MNPKLKLYGRIVASTLFSVLFLALSAHAEEAGSASQQSAENLFKWINFALVAGVIVWLCTVAVGMGLRKASSAGVAASFVVVAASVTAVLLLGWRAVVGLTRRRRSDV